MLETTYEHPPALSSTAIAMERLASGHQDAYEPGTLRERGYMRGISTVYQDDFLDANSVVAAATQREIIGGIEVSLQDAEFDLDDDFF